jgi:hypothetical protein
MRNPNMALEILLEIAIKSYHIKFQKYVIKIVMLFTHPVYTGKVLIRQFCEFLMFIMILRMYPDNLSKILSKEEPAH